MVAVKGEPDGFSVRLFKDRDGIRYGVEITPEDMSIFVSSADQMADVIAHLFKACDDMGWSL